MANALGYEELRVGSAAVGPTASTLTKLGGAKCAVFYVDPEAETGVRWRPDGTPTYSSGFPLLPNRWITVAGEGVIRNTLFRRMSGAGKSISVHAIYFDRVDVVAADFVGQPSMKLIEALLGSMKETNEKVLAELAKHTIALNEAVEAEL